MLHIDEKFKDNSPVKTVENIQSMLRKHGLDVEEKWFESGIEHCHSVTVTVAGTKLSAYGKGVTKELARASGHAELMERLQSGFKGAGGLAFTDMRQMTREELLQENRTHFDRMAQFMNETENVNFTAEDLADCSLALGRVQSCKTIPFFNTETGEKVYLPYHFLRTLYGTNGLAAGNSTAEAIVQGFSEIVERYCQRYFLEGKLTPPDVPEDYLAQFKTAYSVIEQVRAAGYMVIVKDCSMGDGYPVVASAIVNKKDRSCRIMFGASPVFEIALERSLTEAFQGCAIKAMPFVKGFHVGKKRSANDIESAYTRGHANYPLEFFAEKASYAFEPFEDRSNLTNQDLVGYILQYLKKKNRTLLIRDLSHMGFHTYRLIVPGMSEIHTYLFVGDPYYYSLTTKIATVRSDLRNASKEELKDYIKMYQVQPTLVGATPTFSEMTRILLELEPPQDRFLTQMSLAYAHWETGDMEQAYDCLKKAQPYANVTLRDYVACLSQMIEMLVKGYSHEEAARLMSRFYDIRLLVTAQVNCAKGNPFASFLISCKRECEGCQYANVCSYPVNKSVTDRVNAAVAVFDNDAAFENLRNCIETAKAKN